MPIQKLRDLCHFTKGGVTLLDISEAAEKIGFRTTGIKLTLDQLGQAELPCILHWRQNHFVVLYKIKNHRYYIGDPGRGLMTVAEEDFAKNWVSYKELKDGISLLLTPSPIFHEQSDDDKENSIS